MMRGSIVKRRKIIGEKEMRWFVHSMEKDYIILYSLETLEHIVPNGFG